MSRKSRRLRKTSIGNARPTLVKGPTDFTRPVLVAEAEYRAWTQDGKSRHPSFQRASRR
ncbi:hypothetical protein [Sinorhizobium fredii]|uniref:hypothetical protein n=1 Tax=Rhizobium fredii TaxID=380 RepID=UPI00130DE1D1|nr:hypothetical protein [Sinorhizobium fredii]